MPCCSCLPSHWCCCALAVTRCCRLLPFHLLSSFHCALWACYKSHVFPRFAKHGKIVYFGEEHLLLDLESCKHVLVRSCDGFHYSLHIELGFGHLLGKFSVFNFNWSYYQVFEVLKIILALLFQFLIKQF